jgi:TIGR03009 family protein
MMIARIGLAGACAALVVGANLAMAQVGASPYQYQPAQAQPQNPPQQYSQPNANPGVAAAQQPYQAQPYQPQVPQQQPVVPQAPLQPPPPFVLTAEQQALLDKTLDDWERESGKMTTFKCQFKKWKYDPTFLPPELDKNNQLIEKAIRISIGEIKYSAPDKGLIKETDVVEVKNPSEPDKVTETKNGEYWACDGTSLYMVDYAKKEVHRAKLPPELQGKAIMEGPLPFAFGTKAAELKRRYYMQVAPTNKPEEVMLEIRPRFQKDLANFTRVEVIFRAKDMRPQAIQIVHYEQKVAIRNDPSKGTTAESRDVYLFFDTWSILPDINLLWSEFAPHPFNFKIIDEPTAPPATVPPPNTPQARRQWPAASPQRPY